MKKNYPRLKCMFIALVFLFNSRLHSQSSVAYQFYHDANNNCNYDPGENLLYNLAGGITFTYVNTSSSTVMVSDTVNCTGMISVSNPSVPAVNGFTFSPTMSSYSSFSINTSCSAYSNLSYTTTNYLPVRDISQISAITYFTNATGYYTASSSGSFPICTNLNNDTLNIYFNWRNIYSCNSVTSTRTYSLYFDASLIDVVSTSGVWGNSTVSSSSCIINEYYFSPINTVWIRTKLSNTSITSGNHTFEIRSTPIYTPTASAISYSCNLNASLCYVLGGSIYQDCDNNCVKSTGDGAANYAAYVKVFDAANSYTIYPAYNGSFTAVVPATTSQYSITSVPLALNYTPCPSATLTSAVPTTTNVNYDFGYKANGYVDPGVGNPFVPGGVWPAQTVTIATAWYNNAMIYTCPASFPSNSGKVKMVMDQNFTYISSSPVASSVIAGPTGDTVVWNISNFNVSTYNYCMVVAQMASSVAIGTPYTNYAMVLPTNDNYSGNNFAVFSFTVGYPYDPNNKLSWASGMMPNGDIRLSTTDLFYTINFQNVGTAPAINVRSLDTLDANLDWNTLMITSSSFPVQTQLDNTSGQVIFNFQNINLPDSTTNEPASHGFVSYRIKLKPSVPANTIIKNRAHNYFDFQPPVPTNQTKNKLVSGLGLTDDYVDPALTLNPNPVNDKLNIYCKKPVQSVTVYNQLGQLILKQETRSLNNEINFSGLNPGIYFVALRFENGSTVTKKVVKN